jgi:phosphosulfolactate synthase
MSTGLTLPPRPPKPRTTGRTHAIDKGAGPAAVADLLAVAADHLDMVKLGWGTAVVTAGLEEKIATYRRHDVDICLGGTLWELHHLQGRLDEYAAWMKGLGLTTMEISDGALALDPAEKADLISRFAGDFTVLSEVGSKDADAIVTPAEWVAAIRRELGAGAAYVILEGRESGSAGMYRPSGEIRMGLIGEIIDAGIDVDRLVFEAPQKAQQVWLLERVGPDINLANIALDEVVSVETLRLGLRADTLLRLHGDDA